ncbi:MAG: flavodoxin family protein [Erysipelotrichia bacterium]|jgi:flavodoxin|nr:flavodoxin family protein [Erysipelotrichia bacterium]
MNIALIIHSQTGNTLTIAQRLKQHLENDNHKVYLLHIKNKDDANTMKTPVDIITYGDLPSTEFDVVIYGGWVQAFGLCLGFSEYLQHHEPQKSQKVFTYVTQHFPYAWMGGNRALSQMKSILAKKNMQVYSFQVFNKTNKNLEQQIQTWIEKISRECQK